MDTSAGVSKAGPARMAIYGMWCLATSCCLTHWKNINSLLLIFLIQSTSASESILLGISWMNIISGWTKRLFTIPLWRSIQLIVGTGLMKRGLISLVGLKKQKRWLPTSGCPITLISRSEPAAAEATTNLQQKGLGFSTLSRRTVVCQAQYRPTQQLLLVTSTRRGNRIVNPATATFVIQFVPGSLSKAGILGYPGWPWTS